MDKEIIAQLNKTFEESAYTRNGVEYWMARDIQKLLDYDEWRNFENVIMRAKGLIDNGTRVGVITQTTKSVHTGYGAKRKIIDYRLDEDAVMLVKELSLSFKVNKFYSVRNECVLLSLLKKYCDSKGVVFSHQYKDGEYVYDALIGNRILIEFDEPHHSSKRQQKKDISKEIYAKRKGFVIERFSLKDDIIDVILKLDVKLGDVKIDEQGFARLRSKGDQALFGGYTTLEMKKKMGVLEKRSLADFLPTITIKAKDLAAEITSFNTKKNNLYGEAPITGEHIKNNKDVRDLLGKSGIKPELLFPEEDIKKLQRRLQSEGKKIAKNVRMIKNTGGEEAQ